MSERAGVTKNFFFCFSSCVRAGLTRAQCALVVAVISNVRRFWRPLQVFNSQRHFPSYFSSFLSVVALGPTVILRVYSCLDVCPETGRLQHVCRFSKLLLFSFFFCSCKDGSDRLMKRASYSCCKFLCVVLASGCLLEVSPVSLVVLAIRLAFFFFVTRTPPNTHARTHWLTN